MTLSVVFYVLLALFVLAFSVQLYYYLGIFAKLSYFKKEVSNNKPPVSIVICARNEFENLEKHLPLLFSQNYPQYEVVIVNDCSFDATADLLKEAEKQHSNLHVVTLKEEEIYRHDKKLALMLGIKGAKYEHLLLTDADCMPNSENWISTMAQNFDKQTEIVLGYGAYEKRKGFLNKIIRFDSFFAAAQYLSSAIVGKPYMGVGRNLAYTKSLFFKNKGFATHYHIQSGDDDLFVNRAANSANTKIEIEHSSHTISVPKETFKTWFKQKKRHLTTAKHYKSEDRNRLALHHLSHYLFWLSFIALVVLNNLIFVVLGIFILRLVIQMIIFKKAMEKLNEKDLLWLTPIFEFFLLFFYPILVVSNTFVKQHKWK
ncbi:MAG: glycosyltransferase [Bacteroidota bacterium]